MQALPRAKGNPPISGDGTMLGSGKPLPLGAHFDGDGVNFALYSRHAESVSLELFDGPEDLQPRRRIDLDPAHHRTGDVWHVWVRGLRAGQFYAYRVDGPYRPKEGHRYNRNMLLLDPYATAVAAPPDWDFGKNRGFDANAIQSDLTPNPRDDAGDMAKCVVIKRHPGVMALPYPRRPWAETVIYEMHVRGLSAHPSAGAQHPGTYRGIVEKLPYFKALGVTALELMPVFEFNHYDVGVTNRAAAAGLRNYWGYNPVAWFAPMRTYAATSEPGGQVQEFRAMVEACHLEGIEVILDVVFTHSAESDERGPTLNLRGLDNTIYYLLHPDRSHYCNDTGTGNTLRADHPVVRDFILDSLRYWAGEMRVDGFRFDLASVLARDAHGNLRADTPLLERIAEDPILRESKLIAEAWDLAGAYQVGSFSETRWSEWNGRYRDDVRRFWRGDEGLLGRFASRLCGSADLFQGSGKGPESSINFVTCHDGFTLNDLVSYASKHNADNGQDNQDGPDENFSANYGVEGPTESQEIESLRNRQAKNLLLTLLVSRGVPMLLGGDEFRRTQRGNNNAYCQDNEISWFNWTLLDQHWDMHRFTRAMIALRRAHPVLSREAYYNSSVIRFFAADGAPPNWQDPLAKSLGVLITENSEPDLCLLFNAAPDGVAFRLPQPRSGLQWRRVVDTFLPPPNDVNEGGADAALANPNSYSLESRSSVILSAFRG